jgi:uncharacterized RDD family membrane protein YckC
MMTSGDRGGTPLASLSARFGALLVDWLLCLIVAALIGTVDGQPWLAPALLVVLHTVSVGFVGQTPGMYLTKVRCVSTDGDAPIGPARAGLRGLLLILIIPAIVMDGYRRGLHDRAAGSVMVSARPADGR